MPLVQFYTIRIEFLPTRAYKIIISIDHTLRNRDLNIPKIKNNKIIYDLHVIKLSTCYKH